MYLRATRDGAIRRKPRAGSRLLRFRVEVVHAVDLEPFERFELLHEVRVEEVEEVLGDQIHELRHRRHIERLGFSLGVVAALVLAPAAQRRVVGLGLGRSILQEPIEGHL